MKEEKHERYVSGDPGIWYSLNHSRQPYTPLCISPAKQYTLYYHQIKSFLRLDPIPFQKDEIAGLPLCALQVRLWYK